MSNLYKKICIIVLSVVVLVGGILVSSSLISNAYPFEHEIQSVVSSLNDFSNPLAKNYVSDSLNLYDSIIRVAFGSGVYQAGNHFFLV